MPLVPKKMPDNFYTTPEFVNFALITMNESDNGEFDSNEISLG